MLNRARCRLTWTLRRTRAPLSAIARRCHRTMRSLSLAVQSKRAKERSRTFDQALLELLVGPLSKKPLRYEASTNELINEELGIAYPIIDGIPNMIPQAARTTHQNKKQEETEQH
ncbi:protein preY, mitochondrial-like [Sciurus carolinensis]|uniref:protein preY, mitochondrial-like n=1 Tax=Sciurus carolinensis TaxID=30640 RepID=UPI001FB3A7D5|nr:protein preY, mitochondrial-like [Sciurus carolinensis]